MLQALRAVVAGVVSPAARCSRCRSEDVRPSRRPFVLEAFGIHRWRCRTCGRSFLLRLSQAPVEASASWTSGAALSTRAAHPAPSAVLTRSADRTRFDGPDLATLDRDIAAIRAEAIRRG